MCSKLVIIGAGGHGKVVADTAIAAGYDVVGFLDDYKKQGEKVLDFKILGSSSLRVNADCFIVAIGDPYVRATKYYEMIKRGYKPAILIHPHSYVSRYAQLGWGVFIAAGAVIQPGAVIGDNSIINTSASVDHDCVLYHHSTVNPQAAIAGEVEVGYFSVIHTNATILPRIKVDDNSIVGAGAVVREYVPPDTVVVGVPARKLKSNDKAPSKNLVSMLLNGRYHLIKPKRAYRGRVIDIE